MQSSTVDNTDTASMNGHGGQGPSGPTDVDVDVSETIGIAILGFLFFIVLMSFLRATKRERKLLEKIAELQKKAV